VGRIDNVSFSSSLPHDVVICSGAKAHIYALSNLEPKKAFTRFTSNVTCAHIRDDGQMVATGQANGIIQLLDIGSRSILRSFTDHKASVYQTKFLTTGTRLLSCSDDHTAKIFDIPTETIVHEMKCHTDSVRCGMESTLTPDVILTGGYDHSICFTDLRLPQSEQTVLKIDFGAPVTAVTMLPGSGMISAAGENTIKIFDMLSGGRQLTKFQNHSKAITGLTIDQTKSRLLSVSLDGTLRTYNLPALTSMNKIDYLEPLLSVDISKDGRGLAVGSVSGNLFLEKPPLAITDEQKKRHENKSEFYMTTRQRHFFGGSRYEANGKTDIVAEYERKKKLAPFDARLRNFQHGPALDAGLSTASPAIICALIDELDLRGALTSAVSNRDDTGLEPLFAFVLRYLSVPQYSNIVMKFAHVLLDVYTNAVGNSSVVDEWLLKLYDRLQVELSGQRECVQLLGELDLILNNTQ
jgi:U3 small nucleolar RNA-associated protein 15